MRRHIAYLKYVLRHKYFVFQACLKEKLPILIAIVHDWDKFLPDEWIPYAETFYKPDGSKQYVESIAFARAWMLHQHRNGHHWQYWLSVDSLPLSMTNVLVWDRGDAQEIVERNSGGEIHYELRDIDRTRITWQVMPDIFVREMVADWHGAGRAILGEASNTVEWYLKNKSRMILHPETQKRVEELLGIG